MELWGAFREEGTENPFMLIKFSTSNNALAEAWSHVTCKNMGVPYYTYGKVNANDWGFQVYGSMAENTMTVFKTKEASFDIQKAVEQAFGPHYTDMSMAYDIYKEMLPKDPATNEPIMHKRTYVGWNDIMAMKGIITDIQKDRKM